MRQLDPGVHVRITGSKPNSGDRSRGVFTQREHGYDPNPGWFTDQLREANRGFIDQCRKPKTMFLMRTDPVDGTLILYGHKALREYCRMKKISSMRLQELTGINYRRVRALWTGRYMFHPVEIRRVEQALNVHLADMRIILPAGKGETDEPIDQTA